MGKTPALSSLPTMTVHVALDERSWSSSAPAFVVPTQDNQSHLAKVTKAISKARRVAVVCGAGISVQAGIPDFRSPAGLFHTLKRDNPKESLSSGKDLFDASVFRREATTALFCQMVGQLAQLSEAADPTAFHSLLKTLDSRGRLLRVYTQNIDALESKSGLSFGVPDFEERRPRSRKSDELNQPMTSAPPTRLPTPPTEIPRCIPLHGTLQALHCVNCNLSFPSQPHVPALIAGTLPTCIECEALDGLRLAAGKRSRGIGKLRPSVVLYNETHRDGEDVGEAVRRDLIGSGRGSRGGADLLLVVGTSLKVPGTKRIVREFAKSLHARDTPAMAEVSINLTSSSVSLKQSSTARPSGAAPIRTVLLNFDFPAPSREWEGVFDVWVNGDAQSFAHMVEDEILRDDRSKAANAERKRERMNAAEKVASTKTPLGRKRTAPDIPTSLSTTAKKRKHSSTSSSRALKKGTYQPTLVALSCVSRLTIRIPGRDQRPSRSPSASSLSITPSNPKPVMHAQPGPVTGLVPTVELPRRARFADSRPLAAYARGWSSELSDLPDSSSEEDKVLPSLGIRSRLRSRPG